MFNREIERPKICGQCSLFHASFCEGHKPETSPNSKDRTLLCGIERILDHKEWAYNMTKKDKAPLCGLDLTPEQMTIRYLTNQERAKEYKVKKSDMYKVGEKWYVKSAETAALIEVKILHMTEKTVQFTTLPDRGFPERREWSAIKFIERVKEQSK